MSEAILYYNPSCSKCRKTFELLQNAGVTPEIVRYLETPPDRETLDGLVARAGRGARYLLRDGEDLYESLHLDDPKWTDDELIEFMLQHPILINRPILVTEKGVALCRPPELACSLLPDTGE